MSAPSARYCRVASRARVPREKGVRLLTPFSVGLEAEDLPKLAEDAASFWGRVGRPANDHCRGAKLIPSLRQDRGQLPGQPLVTLEQTGKYRAIDFQKDDVVGCNHGRDARLAREERDLAE